MSFTHISLSGQKYHTHYEPETTINFLIPKTSNLGDRHFIIRMLYTNLYWYDFTNQAYLVIFM